VVDGVLDDAVWANAPTVSDFETFIPEFGKTFAELPIEVKNANSHRGRAAHAMVELIRRNWL